MATPTPEARIKEISREICAKRGAHQPSTKQLDAAMPYAIVRYLNEEHAQQQLLIQELVKRHPEFAAAQKEPDPT